MIGRTSSASARVSKKGSNDISAESDGSSNQLLIGIPLFTCNRNTWNHDRESLLTLEISLDIQDRFDQVISTPIKQLRE